jgi:hypothetical protein
VQFNLSGAETATTGTWQANIVCEHTGGQLVEWSRGKILFRPSPGTSGAGNLDLSIPLNWDEFSFTGTPPWGEDLPVVAAGTGIAVVQTGNTYTVSVTGAGSGDVVGPSSAVNNNLAAFDTTTGKLIKDSGVLTSNVVLDNDARLTNARTPTAHASTHATGGSDPLTPADIGAATAAQGALADTAVQPAGITNMVTAASNFGASGRLLIAGGNNKTALSTADMIVSETDETVNLLSVAKNVQLSTFDGDSNLVTSDGNVGLYATQNVIAEGVDFLFNSRTLRPDVSVSIPAGSFSGPLKTDTVGWDWIQIDTAGSTFIAQGFKTASATQAAGTMSATIMAPPNLQAWTTTGCLRLVLIAESVTTTDCKFDVTVLRHDASMINRTSVYSSSNNAFTSTTVPTVFTVNASAFSAQPTAGGFLTIDVRLHTRNNLGAYLSAAAFRFAQ